MSVTILSRRWDCLTSHTMCLFLRKTFLAPVGLKNFVYKRFLYPPCLLTHMPFPSLRNLEIIILTVFFLPLLLTFTRVLCCCMKRPLFVNGAHSLCKLDCSWLMGLGELMVIEESFRV